MIVEPTDAAFDFMDAVNDEHSCWRLFDNGAWATGIYDQSLKDLMRVGPTDSMATTVQFYTRTFRDMKSAQEFVKLHSIQKALDKIKGAE